MPSLWRSLVAGSRRLLRQSTADRELDDEIRHYAEEAAEEYRRAGLSPDDAARAARVELGSAAAVKDQVRGSGWEFTIESMWRDVVYGARTLRRTPGFTAGAVIVLALSIGVNTAVFSLINAILIRPLPVRAPSELGFIDRAPSNWGGLVTYEEMTQWRSATDLFSDVASESGDSAFLGSGTSTAATSGEAVSTNYFALLGVAAAQGRTLSPDHDEAANAAPAIVISDRLWRRQFNADPQILGRTVHLRRPQRADTGWRYTIVGVMPAEFVGIESPWNPTDYWVPVMQRTRELDVGVGEAPLTAGSVAVVIARRRPGVPIEKVQAFVTVQHKNYQGSQALRSGNLNEDRTLVVRDSRRVTLPLDDTGRIAPDRLALAVAGVGGLVLLIGITNLMGVTVARGIVRRPEIAVRLTLGASRGRLARQLVTEGLLLAALGGLGGLMGSRGLVALFLAGAPSGVGLASLNVPMDATVLLFTVVLVLIVGTIVGLAPVREASKTDLLSTLRGSSEAAPARVRSRLRYGIVIPQVCVCLMLLVGAGLATRALLKVALLDLGYEPAHTASATFSLWRLAPRTNLNPEARKAASLAEQGRQEQLIRRVADVAEASPELDASGLTDATPVGGNEVSVVMPDGFTNEAPHYRVSTARVSSGYFSAIGVPIRSGRVFGSEDKPAAPGVVVVDEAFADRLWPGRSPVGERLGIHAQGSTQIPIWLEIVGVVGAVRHPLSEGETRPFLYLPLSQKSGGYSPSFLILVGRGQGSDGHLVKSLRAIVAEADPETIVIQARTMTVSINAVRYPRRLATAILASSAGVGLLLAALGLYGVVSYSVAQRMRELGIRAALGADKADLMWVVMREGIVVALAGSAAGLALAIGGIRLVSSKVFAIPPLDIATLIVVPIILMTVVLLACYLPARRASRVDPMVVLRWL